MRKVLFVDFDGVLSSHQHCLMSRERDGDEIKIIAIEVEAMISMLCAHNVWCLKFIQDNVKDLEFVMSSSWRNTYEMSQIREALSYFGIDPKRVVDKTPTLRFNGHRSDEVMAWLEENAPDAKYLVIDDYSVPVENFKRISQMDGLTYGVATDIVRYFEPTWRQPTICL